MVKCSCALIKEEKTLGFNKSQRLSCCSASELIFTPDFHLQM